MSTVNSKLKFNSSEVLKPGLVAKHYDCTISDIAVSTMHYVDEPNVIMVPAAVFSQRRRPAPHIFETAWFKNGLNVDLEEDAQWEWGELVLQVALHPDNIQDWILLVQMYPSVVPLVGSLTFWNEHAPTVRKLKTLRKKKGLETYEPELLSLVEVSNAR